MQLKNKKIIVAGGAGFIGSNLVKALLKKESKVLVIDNFSQGKKENLKDVISNRNLTIKNADIRDEDAMLKLTKGSEIIFNLAVQCLRVSFKDPFFVHDVNATGTLKLLEAARQNNVERFIYCSSSEVYGTAEKAPMKESHPLNPTTVYGTSKLVGELYTTCYNKNFGLKTVIVRPFNTYGYNEHLSGPYGEVIPRFVVRIKNNLPPIIFGDGKQTRDFTFVDDTAAGLIAACSSEKVVGDIVNIARGEEVSINEIAKIIIKLINPKIKPIYKKARPLDVMRHYADVGKTKKLLKFSAKTDIENGIKKYSKNLEDNKSNFKELLKEIPDKNW